MRVLIADDEPIAREILREHVDAIAGLEFAGEASTGAEAISRIFDLRPDVVLLDLQMPELDGLAVVRSLTGERSPNCSSHRQLVGWDACSWCWRSAVSFPASSPTQPRSATSQSVSLPASP